MDAPKKTLIRPQISSAIASVEAEGFEVDADTIDRVERLYSGALSADEAREEALAAARGIASGS